MRRKPVIFGMVLAAIAVGIALFIWSGGGDRSKGAMGVASSFLDSYYVSIKLELAKELTEGRAKAMVSRQLDEIQKIPRAERNPSSVKYRLLDERYLGDRKKAFSFELSIQPHGGVPFRRLVFLNLRRTGSGWRVQSFQEHNPSN